MNANHSSSCEQNAAIVVQKAKEFLSDEIRADSGTILYSSYKTLRPGKYYFLGLNPGGGDADTESIEQSLEALGARTENAYLEEDWGSTARSYGNGGHPLQLNYKCLFKGLGVDPDSVCASNLIFRRSVDEKGARYEDLVEACWRVHEAILEIVRPEAIITFGRQPFDFIRNKKGGTLLEDRPAGHGTWTWRRSVLTTGEKLIGLPHLSRYALRCHSSVVEEIKKFLA